MQAILFILTIPAVLGIIFAGVMFLMCFIGTVDNIVEELTTKNTTWELVKKAFLTGCVSGTIGGVFVGIIHLIK